MMFNKKHFLIFLSSALMLTQALAANGVRKSNASPVDATKNTTESQIRQVIEPLLDRYCRDECKLMNVSVNVDISAPDNVAPGFDEVDPRSSSALVASGATLNLMIDEKIGPVTRGKLLEFTQKNLENTFDFPIKVETQVTHFPQPVGSSAKVVSLRDKVTKDFKNTIEEIFRKFCPDQCMLADYDLQSEVMNPEEAQYGQSGEFVEDGGTAIRIKNIASTILMDETLTPEEQQNVLEMAKLKTNSFKNVSIAAKAMKFPSPTGRDANGNPTYASGSARGIRSLASEKNDSTSKSDSSLNSNKSETNQTSQNLKSNQNSSNSNSTNSSNRNAENTDRKDSMSHFEKIERVESGDAVQAELNKFKFYGMIFGCIILSLLVFIAAIGFRKSSHHVQNSTNEKVSSRSGGSIEGSASLEGASKDGETGGPTDKATLLARRYECARLYDELMGLFATQPKVAKHVFSRILTEQGIETTAKYIHIFGDSVIVDMLRDPSLQSDLNQLLEFYAKNPVEMEDDERLDLLKKLHNRAVAGKLTVMGARSSHLFEFLTDMDGLQILELVRNESLTVKAIVITQCDSQKRLQIFKQIDEDTRFKLLTELSRIDYLPRDYINNVATALKRKRRENPKLNTEALPGSEVLLTLLEKTDSDVQRSVIKNLETSSPESAHHVRAKLVSIDTLKYLRDGHVLEVVLGLRHDELLQFLKGAPGDIRSAVFNKAPKDLVADLEDELQQGFQVTRETYQAVERKIINRIKLMSSEGLINLNETNERMFADLGTGADGENTGRTKANAEGLRKVAGW